MDRLLVGDVQGELGRLRRRLERTEVFLLRRLDVLFDSHAHSHHRHAQLARFHRDERLKHLP